MSYFGAPYPRERVVRVAALDRLEGERREGRDPFMAQDEAFFECLNRETFEAAADRYAQASQ